MPFDIERLCEKYPEQDILKYYSFLLILFHKFRGFSGFSDLLESADLTVRFHYLYHGEYLRGRDLFPAHRFYTNHEELKTFPRLAAGKKFRVYFKLLRTYVKPN